MAGLVTLHSRLRSVVTLHKYNRLTKSRLTETLQLGHTGDTTGSELITSEAAFKTWTETDPVRISRAKGMNGFQLITQMMDFHFLFTSFLYICFTV